MNEAFGLFAHVNVLQRDMCPSATRFEGEIIAMTLDLMHADAVDDAEPAGMVTSGGSDSILQAMLAYREHGRKQRGITEPNIVKPETAHPAFDKACHLLGIELRARPVDPETTLVDVDRMADAHRRPDTIAIVGSAGNYGYGTIDPIERARRLAPERGIGLHVDGCLGGFILPWGQELGLRHPAFDFRVPGVTTISADTHKYGYGFKGTSVLLVPRPGAAERPVLLHDRLERRQVLLARASTDPARAACSPPPGRRWSAWAGTATGATRRRSSTPSAAMQDAVRSHPELRILGEPTFLFAFTSDEFDIYHVND